MTRIDAADKRTRPQRIRLTPQDWQTIDRLSAPAPASQWVRDAATEAAELSNGARRRAPRRRNWNPHTNQEQASSSLPGERLTPRTVRFSQHEWDTFTRLATPGTPSEWVREAALEKLAKETP